MYFLYKKIKIKFMRNTIFKYLISYYIEQIFYILKPINFINIMKLNFSFFKLK